MTLISDALIVALAGLFTWVFASQLHTPGFGKIQRWLRRGWRVGLVGCPWCSGWWLGWVLTLAIQYDRLDWITTPAIAVASAGLIGFLGSMTPGMDEEDGDED